MWCVLGSPHRHPVTQALTHGSLTHRCSWSLPLALASLSQTRPQTTPPSVRSPGRERASCSCVSSLCAFVSCPGDARTANDSYAFLQGFLQRYPAFANSPFWIAGESYGGHYVPGLAEAVVKGNAAVRAAWCCCFVCFTPLGVSCPQFSTYPLLNPSNPEVSSICLFRFVGSQDWRPCHQLQGFPCGKCLDGCGVR